MSYYNSQPMSESVRKIFRIKIENNARKKECNVQIQYNYMVKSIASSLNRFQKFRSDLNLTVRPKSLNLFMIITEWCVFFSFQWPTVTYSHCNCNCVYFLHGSYHCKFRELKKKIDGITLAKYEMKIAPYNCNTEKQ